MCDSVCVTVCDSVCVPLGGRLRSWYGPVSVLSTSSLMMMAKLKTSPLGVPLKGRQSSLRSSGAIQKRSAAEERR